MTVHLHASVPTLRLKTSGETTGQNPNMNRWMPAPRRNLSISDLIVADLSAPDGAGRPETIWGAAERSPGVCRNLLGAGGPTQPMVSRNTIVRCPRCNGFGYCFGLRAAGRQGRQFGLGKSSALANQQPHRDQPSIAALAVGGCRHQEPPRRTPVAVAS